LYYCLDVVAEEYLLLIIFVGVCVELGCELSAELGLLCVL
jgi:hypothetical protein